MIFNAWRFNAWLPDRCCKENDKDGRLIRQQLASMLLPASGIVRKKCMHAEAWAEDPGDDKSPCLFFLKFDRN